MSYETYAENFEVTDEMIEEMVKMGEANGVNRNSEDLIFNKELIKLHTKAQIARRVWGNEGFYPIYNQTNEILQGAVQLIDKSVELDKLEY